MADLYPLASLVLRALPPESAHNATLFLLRHGLVPAAPKAEDDPALGVRLWGRQFSNPIGLAAGFDKNAEVPDAMLALGFGFVEVGTVTPRPQPGNPKPRLFRLPRDRAVINRFGFNSEGLEKVAARLQARLGSPSRRPGIVGANVGKNRDSEDAAADYATGAARLADFADYLVMNVSSPNTPGLRDLQARAQLEKLIARVRAACEGHRRVPLLLKIAPDLGEDGLRDIADVAVSSGIDGVIVSNTTVSRPPGVSDPKRAEQGGLSGAPLYALSTQVLGELYRLTGGSLPLIGVGGISSGRDAYGKIRAGASLVQLYTALAYEGPALIGRIKTELAALLQADGFAHVADAVGADFG